MMHQSGRKKLNLKHSHRVAMLRNQMIHLINYGHLTTTKARVKEVQKLIVTVIAPRYVQRPGGYTRVISMGKRASDTAPIARIEWV